MAYQGEGQLRKWHYDESMMTDIAREKFSSMMIWNDDGNAPTAYGPKHHHSTTQQ